MQDLSVFSIQPVQLLLDDQVHWLAYLIHDSGGPNQLLLDSVGCFVVGRDLASLESALRELDVSIDEESPGEFADGQGVAFVSLDGLTPMPRTAVDPTTAGRLWNGWSMLDDMCLTIGRPLDFRGQIARNVIDKLFWGLNLAAVTPPGEGFAPRMSGKERAKWDQIITAGLERLAPAMAKA